MFKKISDIITPQKKHNPIRKYSYLKGNCEHKIFRAVDRTSTQNILLAAKKYNVKYKEFGKKNGALGGIAIEILEYFVNLIDFKTGRLEPSLETIMRKIGRSKDAVVKGLNNLRTHGFIDWIRRYEPTGLDYPRVKQKSNAYRLNLPEKAKLLLKAFGIAPPLPSDKETAIIERQRELKQYEQESVFMPEYWNIEEGNLKNAMVSFMETFLNKNIGESVKQTENQANFNFNEKKGRCYSASFKNEACNGSETVTIVSGEHKRKKL